jgi:nitrous oxidase accessory protein
VRFLKLQLLVLGATLAASPGSRAVEPSRPGAPQASPLQERIDSASPGATIDVGPGIYKGHLRIDRSVRLVGHGRPILDAGGTGDVVEIAAENVTLRGFVVRSTGTDLYGENVGVRALSGGATIEDNELADVLFGIDCKAAPRCVIRGNTIGGKHLDIARRGDGIRLWRSDGSVIEGNTIRDGRDCILWYSDGVIVRGNTSERCRYGFHLMYSNDATIEGNTLTGNSVGIYFMYSKGMTLSGNRILHNRGPSGFGIGLKDTDTFTIENNLIAGNRVGIYVDNGAAVHAGTALIARNTLATNDTGIQLLPSVKGGTFTENSFLDNFEQVGVLGRGSVEDNEFERGGRGNFWSDYAGYDLDGDGIGESSYEARKLFENMTAREPKLRLWLFSPAQEAIEFVARAVPAVQPEAKFEDVSPLVRPVGCVLPVPVASSSRPMWTLAVLLVGGAGAGMGIALVPGVRRRRAAGAAPTPIEGALA